MSECHGQSFPVHFHEVQRLEPPDIEDHVRTFDSWEESSPPSPTQWDSKRLWGRYLVSERQFLCTWWHHSSSSVSKGVSGCQRPSMRWSYGHPAVYQHNHLLLFNVATNFHSFRHRKPHHVLRESSTTSPTSAVCITRVSSIFRYDSTPPDLPSCGPTKC